MLGLQKFHGDKKAFEGIGSNIEIAQKMPEEVQKPRVISALVRKMWAAGQASKSPDYFP
jgi:hypothetical protein